MCFVSSRSGLRVVHLSLSPSCEMRKKPPRKKWPREILAARCTCASGPQDLTRPLFSLAGFFRVLLDGLSERETTRSLSRSGVLRFVSRHGVLSCRVWPSLRIWCAVLLNSGLRFLVYLICPEHDRLGFGMLTVERAVFDCFQSRQKCQSLISGRLLFGVGGRVLWG